MGDEFTRVAKLRELLKAAQLPAGVELGIGDDAAVLAPMAAGTSLVLSVDASVEDVHFSRRFATWAQLAERAFAAALSDLAAMGAQPRAALSALCLPHGFSDADFEQLSAGTAHASQEYACPVIGGNLAQASELSITTTVIGEVASGAALTRAGARDGDGIYVTGVLGAAALGLVLLQADATDVRGDQFIAHWRKPRARITEGRALVGHATAAIDVSDGLAQDLGHLCEASGVGAVLDAEHLPFARGFSELAHLLGRDAAVLALTGGEDYELVYTLPPDAPALDFGTRIGVIDAQRTGVEVRDATGHTLSLPVQGYRHFG